jgi:TRAP-type C4-dicarboxylate transport system permease small subunit
MAIKNKIARSEIIVRSFSRVLDRIAQGAVVIMMFLVCINIVLRLVWRPILGTYEFVTFLGAVIISFALAYCAVEGGHVAVTILVDRLPRRTQAIIDLGTGILGVFIFALVAWECGVFATNMWSNNEVSQTTHVPFYPFVYGMGFGCLLLCLVILIGVFKSAARALNK